jgi:hypothetical protein
VLVGVAVGEYVAVDVGSAVDVNVGVAVFAGVAVGFVVWVGVPVSLGRATTIVSTSLLRAATATIGVEVGTGAAAPRLNCQAPITATSSTPAATAVQAQVGNDRRCGAEMTTVGLAGVLRPCNAIRSSRAVAKR